MKSSHDHELIKRVSTSEAINNHHQSHPPKDIQKIPYQYLVFQMLPLQTFFLVLPHPILKSVFSP